MLAASTGNHDATRALIMAGAPINQEYQVHFTIFNPMGMYKFIYLFTGRTDSIDARCSAK